MLRMSSRSACLPPSLVDQLEQELVSLLLQAQESGEWTVSLEHPCDAPGGRREQADRAVPEGEHRGQAPPQRVEALARIEAEDRAQDDLQRQPLQAGAELDRLSARPARNLPAGHLRDQVAETLHPFAVEGGEHQLALLHVRGFIEQDDRVRADDGFEHPSSLTGVKNVRAAP